MPPVRATLWAAAWPLALATGLHAPETLNALSLQHLPLVREAVLDGQAWRLLSAHWVHTNTAHLLLNLGGWGLVAAAHAPTWRRETAGRQCLVWIGLCLGTSALLLGAFPQVSPYLGLSGVLHGWWLWLAWRSVQSGDALWGWGSLLVLLGKLVSEATGSPQNATAQWIGARVAVEGHVCGAAAAAVLLMAAHLCQRWPVRSPRER